MCAQCHGDLMKAETSGSNHNPFAEGECLTCHNAHGSNIAGMLTGKQVTLCFSCHDDLSKALKAAKKPTFAFGRRRMYKMPWPPQDKAGQTSSCERVRISA